MLILRQKMRAKPDKSDELMAALAEIIAPARATDGVISLDIARVLLEPDSFIATAVYEDGAALERQESRPEVHKVVAMLPESLAAPLERTIFDASLDPALVDGGLNVFGAVRVADQRGYERLDIRPGVNGS